MLKTKWTILYDIKLHHPYYINEACRALEIMPTTACKRLLQDYGLQFKAYKGGALILGEQISNDNGATWKWKRPVISTIPIKFVFTIVITKDYETFEKATFLDDFTAPATPPKIEVRGKTVYYFDNLDDTTAEVQHSGTNELSVNTNVGKEDRIKLITEVLQANFNASTSAKLKFKKVKNAPLSEAELTTINLDNSLNMNDLYRNYLNASITNPNNKIFPPAPEGFYELVISATEKIKIYRDLMLANQAIWGIVEIFEDIGMVVGKTTYNISFLEKNTLNKFSKVDKGEDPIGNVIYPISEFYTYFIAHGNTPYKEKIQYPDL